MKKTGNRSKTGSKRRLHAIKWVAVVTVIAMVFIPGVYRWGEHIAEDSALLALLILMVVLATVWTGREEYTRHDVDDSDESRTERT